MDSMKPWNITCTFFCLLLLGSECLAQAASTPDLNALKAEIEALKTDCEKRIQAPEMQIQQLQSESPQTRPASATAASKVFNPDIVVIGDFIGISGSNHVTPDPALQMHESEVVAFQAIVDPYARADFFFSDGEVVTLEEG
jgi:hypothetical protein